VAQLLEQITTPGALRARFQPIYDISGDQPVMQAAECLIRGPEGSNVEFPDVLFSYARQKRAEGEIDKVAIAVALAAASVLPLDLGLHLNVHASTLGRDPGFPEFLVAQSLQCGRSPERLTVEIVEQSDFVDRIAFQASLDTLRGQGFTIALDDVGLGRSNFQMIYLSRPTVLKIDRFFVDGVSTDSVRHAVLVSIQRLAGELGATVVAEGVEEEIDLAVIKELGIARVQGYLLGRPMTAEQLAHELERVPTPELVAPNSRAVAIC
jgi:EAL domain-containing protein (putative c-di-GMP-specific phosphodiesterase class I)